MQQPIVSIDDPDFIEKMDSWYKSTNYQTNWSTQIPTYLSYFIYWCCNTKLNVYVNSTIYAGYYYYATKYFKKYLRNAHRENFQHGYPLSISNENNQVRIYQIAFDDVMYFELSVQFTDPKEFNKNLYFKYDDESEFYPDDSFFKDAIEHEINQLFYIDPMKYG